MTTPPSAETRNKSPSPNGKRSGGSGNKGKSSPISSDTSPDRLSGSNSTLKSTQPKCQGEYQSHLLHQIENKKKCLNKESLMIRMKMMTMTLPTLNRKNGRVNLPPSFSFHTFFSTLVKIDKLSLGKFFAT